MISAIEANKRTHKKLSPAAIAQLKEIEEEIMRQINYTEGNNDPDFIRSWIYYDKHLLDEVRVMLVKTGYKIITDGIMMRFPGKDKYCISWQEATPYVYRGPKIT